MERVHILRRPGLLAALAGLAALAAGLGLGLTTLGLRGSGDARDLPSFLEDAVGPALPSGSPTANLGDDVGVALRRNGYTVSLDRGQAVTLAMHGSGSAWTAHANGVTRSTPYGHEILLLVPRRAEQFLAVSTRQGARTWRWRLDTNGLEPRLRADGGIDLWDGSERSELGLSPVAIFDADGRDITPDGLDWRLAGKPGAWRLELPLDDADLPLPYLIDPGVVLSGTATADNGAGAASLTIPRPAGVVEGDLLVAQVTVRANVTITAPAGWSVLQNTNNGAFIRQAVYRRNAGASEPASYAFTLSVAGRATGGIAAYGGVGLTLGLTSSTATGTSATPTAGSIAPGAANTMLVALYGIDNGDQIAPPAGMTERWDVVSSDGAASSLKVGSEAADVLQAANAATGTKVATATTSGNWVAQLLALRPDIVNPTIAVNAPTEQTGVGNQFYVAGTRTQYFRPTGSGSFDLNATSTDASGVRKVNFPDLSAFGGWSGAGGDDTTSPYTSPVTYSWSAGAAAPGVQNVTATDFAGNTASQTITIAADATGPTGMTATLVGGPGYSTLSVPLTLTNGADAASGVDATSGLVERDTATLTSGVCGAFPGTWSTVTLSGGADTTVVAGNCYRYRRVISDNVGNQAAGTPSANALVDTTAPTAAPLSVAETPASGAQHVVGTTVYYRPGASGTFTVTSAATDAESGIASVTFPAIAPVAGGTDATSPYTRAYAWTAATTATGAQTVTATNGSGISGGAATFTLTQDATAPTGGSVDYPDGYDTDGTVTITTTNGTDTGSGLNAASAIIQRSTATLTGGTCGAFGAWATVTSPNTVTTGNCAQYRYQISDNVGNTTTYTTTNTVKVDTSAPAAPTQTLTETPTSANQHITATTLYYQPGATGGSFTVTSTATDTQSGIASVNFPAVAGLTGGGADSSSPYTSLYTWNAATSASGAQSVTATNGAGLTGAAGTFTLAPDSTPPAGGSVTYPNGYDADGIVTITTANGADGGSGINAASGLLERRTATLGGGTCGGYGAWSTVTSPNTIPDGLCAQYRYSITDNVGNTATYTSANVARVDLTGPSAAPLSVAETPASGAQHVVGTTVYYRPGASGTFTVTSAATDAESGIASVTFPAIAPVAGGTDATSPYTRAYAWTAATTATGAQTVTATNGSGISGGAATFTLTQDATAPTGGSVDYPDGYDTDGTVTITTTNGTDTGSGLNAASAIIQRSTATLTGGTCGAFGAWATVTSPNTVTTGNCAQYRYQISDNVGNTTTYTTTNTVKVDTSAPAAPTQTLTETPTSANQHITATTLYYQPGATGGSFTVTSTATDTQSGIASVNFPAVAGLTGGGADSSSPYTSLYTWNAATSASGAQSVTATNGAGLTSVPGTFTLTPDSSPPSGGSVDYPDGYDGDGTVTITTAGGTDAGSGLDASTGVLERHTAALGGGTCGGYGAWSTVTSPDTIPDGLCAQYRYSITDNVGNTATYTSANVVKVDLSGPTTPVVTLSESSPYAFLSSSTAIFVNTGQSGTFDVSATADDAESGIDKVSFPNGVDDTSAPYSATYGLGDLSGAQTVTAVASNGLTASAGFTVTPDTTPPSGGSVDYPDGYDADGSVTITSTDGADGESGLAAGTGVLERATATLAGGTCGSYGSWTPVTSPDTISGGLCARYQNSVSDNVGNVATYTSANVVKFDGTDPIATMDDPGSPLSGTVTLSSTANDPESGVATTVYEISPAGASTWTPVTNPWDTTSVADGLYDLHVVVTNTISGVTTSAPVTDRLVDNTSPGGGGGPGGQYLSGTVTLTASPTDSGAGVVSVEFQYRPTGSGPWTTIDTDTDGSDGWSADWDTTSVPDGDYDIQAVVTDGAANQGTITIGTKTVDNTPPTASIDFGPTDPSPTTTAAFGLASTESGSSFACSIDAGAFSACTDPKTYTGLALGPHTFQVQAIDLAGNTSAPAGWSWTVTSPPPPSPSPSRSPSDQKAPTTPENFRGELDVDGETLFLRWDPATDDVAVTAYLLYDRSKLVATISGDQLHAKIGPYGHDDPRVFTLAAADKTGNASPQTYALLAVPDVAGLASDAAGDAVEAAGFEPGTIVREPSNEVAKGLAVRAGDEPIAREGSTLPIVVSSGHGKARLTLRAGRPTIVAEHGKELLRVTVRTSRPTVLRAALARPGEAPVMSWRTSVRAGRHTLELILPRTLPDGRYRLVLRAGFGAEKATVKRFVAIAQ